MSALTTHVLDTARGRPAVAVPVRLLFVAEGGLEELARGATDDDGRISDLLPSGHRLKAGVYQIVFDTESYFEAQGASGFYPEVRVTFRIEATDEHYHVPLLLSPFGYSTYRGT